MIGVTPSSSKRAKAGDEQPVITRTNERHEEFWHLMSVGDLVITFAVHLHRLSAYRLRLIGHFLLLIDNEKQRVS